MDPFDSLGDHYCLQTASEVRSYLSFKISDLNYLHIHVHIAYMFWAHFCTVYRVNTRFCGRAKKVLQNFEKSKW